MSQAEELRHQASSSSHEVDQDQEEEGQLGNQMEEVSNKTLLRLLSIIWSVDYITLSTTEMETRTYDRCDLTHLVHSATATGL